MVIGLSASITLNYAAKNEIDFQWVLVVYFVVLGLNVLRFLYWGFLLKKFNLSDLYPLTALFFPLIYFYSIYLGESQWSVGKITGVLIIVCGIYLFERKTIV